MARRGKDEDAKRGLMPIVRQLVQKVVIGKTPGHQPASLQVHGLIASIRTFPRSRRIILICLSEPVIFSFLRADPKTRKALRFGGLVRFIGVV
jgi:hypothetical protein